MTTLGFALEIAWKDFDMFNRFAEYFYGPGLKGPPGASSNRIVPPFVCL